jgi:predicted RNase H-like HicB family nuclease
LLVKASRNDAPGPQLQLSLYVRDVVNIFGTGKTKQQMHPHEMPPILVRFWPEDDVWNASALDLGVAVSGDTFEEARDNFEEALNSHFDLLVKMGRCEETVERLRIAAYDRGFYDRIKPRETFEKFPIPTGMASCFA